jgi:CrcB protein
MRQMLEYALFISVVIVELLGRKYPFETLIVNVRGSFPLAMSLAWFAKRARFEESFRLFVAVGFFGAYTTFSPFASE